MILVLMYYRVMGYYNRNRFGGTMVEIRNNNIYGCKVSVPYYRSILQVATSCVDIYIFIALSVGQVWTYLTALMRPPFPLSSTYSYYE